MWWLLKRILMVLFGIVILLGVFIGVLLLEEPSTPAFVDAEGNPIEGSIAKIEWVEIGGIPQWVLIRSRNMKNPPLIIMHGGPGSPEAEIFRAFNGDLEDHFTVIHWHQRASGWTISGNETDRDYELDVRVNDVDDLVRHVYERFGDQKVYLLGHSWGSFLGIRYIRDHPERVAAYVGVGQISDMVKSEQLGCDYIREKATEAGDAEVLEELDTFCRPPFTAEYVIEQRGYLSRYKGDMQADLTIAQLALAALQTEEGTLRSVIRLVQGSLTSVDRMWDDIMQVNFFNEPKEFEVPVYFALGRTDFQVSASLAAQYFDEISAPCKTLTWFEKSGHSPMFEEVDAFHTFMVETVLPFQGCSGV